MISSNLSKIRDGIFLCITLIYACGYFTWAIISQYYKIGLLSVFDFQYFIAGLPLFFAFLLTFLTNRILGKFTFYFWPKYYSKLRTNIQLFISITISVLNFLFTGFLIYVTFTYSKDELGSAFIIVLFCINGILILIGKPHIISRKYFKSTVTNNSDQLNTKKDRRPERFISYLLIQRIFTIYFIPFILFMIGIQLFIFNVYPKIPQAYGGAKPQYAYFDITRNNFSNHTLSKLLDANDLPRDENSSRSKLLKIYFSNDKSFYVEVLDSTNSSSKIIEISRQSINVIYWINQE